MPARRGTDVPSTNWWLQQETRDDRRLLKVQVDRVAEGIRSTTVGALGWLLCAAACVSSAVPFFGRVSIERCLLFYALAAFGALVGYCVLPQYYRARDAIETADDAYLWTNRFFWTQLGGGVLQALAFLFVWEPGNLANHLFLWVVWMVIAARFMVYRVARLEFFLASVVPYGVVLFFRSALELTPADAALAVLGGLFVLQILVDGRRLRERRDMDTHLRFANEDMARELEEARDEALKKRFEAEAANASKTTFLANMSHELRTPLNAILGFSEIIASECLGPIGSQRYKEYAGDIHNSGAHLLSLINDLLDVAKIEAGRMEIEPHMIDTQHTIDVALNLVAMRARERGQTLTITVEPDAAVIYADERSLKQILINLVANSVKFTPERGHIDVIASRNREGDFELLVKDDGPGIAKEKLDRIFQPFSQIDNRYDRQEGGTGLGLALVRGLTELHGGRAWIESANGQGTQVYVVLPANHDFRHRIRA
jgi:two-component system cell cycle sensor histidine kinase PleC